MSLVTPEERSNVRCPKCAQAMTTLWTEGEWQYYRCDAHGIIVLSPDRQAQTDEPDDSKVRR